MKATFYKGSDNNIMVQKLLVIVVEESDFIAIHLHFALTNYISLSFHKGSYSTTKIQDLIEIPIAEADQLLQPCQVTTAQIIEWNDRIDNF